MPPRIQPGHQRMAIWVWDNSATAWIDNSIAARSSSSVSDSFSILADTADFLYIGLEDRFDMAIFFLTSTGGSVGARTWEYYDGDSWNTFAPGLDYDFASSNAERFDRLINWRKLLFSSTVPQYIENQRYLLKLRMNQKLKS